MDTSVWQRRKFLEFMGLGLSILSQPSVAKTSPKSRSRLTRPGLPFEKPVAANSLDDLILPEEFSYQVVVQWGDPLTADGQRFGFNNDYTAFIELGSPDEGLLWVNHEYISEELYKATYPIVFAQPWPTTKTDQIELYKKDLGGSVVHLKRSGKQWQLVQNSPYNRRLDVHSPMQASGPAAKLFATPPVGTFANCSGGVTPWGTVLSCEENFQFGVPENAAFVNEAGKLTGKVGSGGLFQLPGEHYGWVVEVDPSDPKSIPVKHTALGRFRHENIALKLEEGKPLMAYMGDDRQGGHVWRYVSRGKYRSNLSRDQKSRLFSSGTLYVAQFDPQGKPDPETGLVMTGQGHWLPFTLATVLKPNTPSQSVDLPDNLVWQEGGLYQRADGKSVKTLGDLYASLGAALVDANRAAHALGATPSGRPEDLEIHPLTRQVYISFTSYSAADVNLIDPARLNDAGHLFDELPPALQQKQAKQFVWGQVWKLEEGRGLSFRWGRFVARPDQLGFAMPDNLVFDHYGNLWLCTDVSTNDLNDAAPQGQFGNNALYILPTNAALSEVGKAQRFASGPGECELTGPTFTADETTLFLSVQHPGERMGIRTETTPQDSRGNRRGSNWPHVNKLGMAPRPAVVAITRKS